MVLFCELRIGRHWIETALAAQHAKPVIPNGNMADFVAKNDVKDRAGADVTRTNELCLDWRRSIKAPSLKGTRHQSQAGEQIVLRLLGHFPQRVVRRKGAVLVAERLKVVAKQLEVKCFFLGNTEPLLVEEIGHSSEPPNDVQSKVDRVQFDVRKGVDESSAAFRSPHRSLPELGMRHQCWPIRTARNADRLCERRRDVD